MLVFGTERTSAGCQPQFFGIALNTKGKSFAPKYALADTAQLLTFIVQNGVLQGLFHALGWDPIHIHVVKPADNNKHFLE